MVIGLILAPVAVHMTMGKTGDGAIVLFPQANAMIIGLCVLGTTILVSILGKELLRLIPILCGIAVGYILALVFGYVDFSGLTRLQVFPTPEQLPPDDGVSGPR